MLFSEVEKRLPMFSFLWGYDAEGDDRLTVADAIHYARGEFGFEATGNGVGWVASFGQMTMDEDYEKMVGIPIPTIQVFRCYVQTTN